MNVITNMKKGKQKFDGELLKPSDVNVSPEEYYVHPKLEEDFEDLKTTVREIKDFGSEMGARNYLFSGPPGTGKTLAGRVLSAELELPFYDITSFIKGQSPHINQVFDELRMIAESNGKGVLAFIDEVEGLSNSDNIVDPLQYQALTQVLSQLDGVKNNQGVFVVGTTNRPNDLDEAVRSRFSEEIEFLPPDKNGRYEILKIHANGKGGHKFEVSTENLMKLAEKSYGYVGRDLKQVLNRAFVRAKRDNRTTVSSDDLEYGLKKTKPGAIRDMPFVEPKIKLDDVIGYEDNKMLLQSIFERCNESVMLLYGPKGTGKTWMAEALAGEFGYNFILLKGSELESKWVGESKDNIERVIRKAKQLSPCVLCFDEISSFVERRGVLSHKDSQTGYLQSVLSRPPEGVYIIGTDNNPDFLKGPFIDRFVHKLFFGLPTREEQLLLWSLYASEVDAEKLVTVNDKLSCRDIVHACKKIENYGLPKTFEVFERIIQGIPEDQDSRKYEQVIKLIGDDVRDYQAIKKFKEEK